MVAATRQTSIKCPSLLPQVLIWSWGPRLARHHRHTPTSLVVSPLVASATPHALVPTDLVWSQRTNTVYSTLNNCGSTQHSAQFSEQLWRSRHRNVHSEQARMHVLLTPAGQEVAAKTKLQLDDDALSELDEQYTCVLESFALHLYTGCRHSVQCLQCPFVRPEECAQRYRTSIYPAVRRLCTELPTCTNLVGQMLSKCWKTVWRTGQMYLCFCSARSRYEHVCLPHGERGFGSGGGAGA